MNRTIKVDELSDAEKQQILRNVFDPEKILLVCEKHKYGGSQNLNSRPPADGCPACWQVFLTHIVAQFPPSRHAEIIGRLEALIHYLIENPAAVKLYRQPKIDVETGTN
jgi:hypothetical protein